MSAQDALERVGGEVVDLVSFEGGVVRGVWVERARAASAWAELGVVEGHVALVLGSSEDVEALSERCEAGDEWKRGAWRTKVDGEYEALGLGYALGDLIDGEVGPREPRAVTYGVSRLASDEALEILSGAPAERVALGLVPVPRMWEVPLALRLGGVDDDPPPWIHAALLKRWEKEWGARLLSASPGMIEVLVERAPSTWPGAFELAREHVDYCPGLVGDGFTVAKLAGRLKTARVWGFVW